MAEVSAFYPLQRHNLRQHEPIPYWPDAPAATFDDLGRKHFGPDMNASHFPHAW
jgi:hypothetical protein